ncbi:phosphotransferase [Paenibacillus sp. GCM10027628]|uniref:phosphotransferase n=1 Tax=Paenibacillus sp. GCM10027628 TaxID=3273413 RepID=UPI003629C63C
MADRYHKEWFQDIASHYGLRIRRIKSYDSLYKKNVVYRATTDKGKFLIKPLNTRMQNKYLTKEQQAVKLFSFIRKLRKRHYPNFPGWLTTSSGKYYVNKNGKPYYMTEWINGRSIQIDAKDYEALGKALATLHTICKDRLPPMSPFTRQQINLFKREERLFRLRLKNVQKKRSSAKRWFEKHGNRCIELANEAWRIIETHDVRRILSHEKNHPALIHGDVTIPNIVINEKGLFLIDWDSLRMGSTYYELAKTLSNTTYYNPDLLSAMLRAYEEVKPLKPAERLLISALFRLPREAWIAVRNLTFGRSQHYFRLLERSWDIRLQAIHTVDEWARKK